MKPARTLLAAVPLTLLTLPALSFDHQPYDGAIVIRDDVPVYAASKGEKITSTLGRGDSVAVKTFRARSWYNEVDGRVQVFFLLNAERKHASGGWMDPRGLSRFTYYGPCQRYDWDLLRFTGQAPAKWDSCFLKAREKKLKELALQP